MTGFAAHPVALAETRFRPIPLRVPVARRPALVAALESAAGIAVTIISAPAGYGKSVLLGEWYAHCLAGGGTAAWLTLDAADADIGRFRQSLACAIHGYDGLRQDLATEHAVLEAELGAALGSARDGRLHLFLDNLDALDGADAISLLTEMAGTLRGRVRWTIASRPGRLQAFARLRAQGIVQVVSASDLRLGRREVASLLGRRLSPADQASIDDRLKGWPVAVQALRLESAREAEISTALLLVRGARGFLADYITTEVIAPLPDEIIEFLCDVSIISEIDAATADLIRNRSDSRRLLTSLELLDDLAQEMPNGRWNLHPLLREYLERRFECQPEVEVIARRMATAKLLAARHDYIGAVRNALLAGRPREAVELIEGLGVVHLWCRFGIHHTLEIMAPLPALLATDYPAIRLREVLSLLKEGRTTAASNLNREIYAAAVQLPVEDASLRKLEIETACIEAIISVTREVFSEELLDHVARLSLSSDGHSLNSLSVVTTLIRIVAHQQWGEIDQADRLLPLAQQLASRWASSLNDYFLNIYQGWIAAARGRPQDAITFYRHMPEIADANGSQDLRCLGEVMVAEALLAIGDFKAAAAQIALWLVPLERSQAWFDFFAAAYVTAAYLSLRSDGLYAALAVLERMRILAVDRDAPSLLRLIPPLKLSLLLRAGTWKEARAWEAEQQIGIACHALPENPRASSWRERDLLLATMAEFYIRAKNLPEARACIQRLEDDALRHGRAGAILTARSLRSSLIWGQGGRGQAIILLGEVLEEAVASGQRGLILERLHLIEPMLAPLHRAKLLRTAAARRQLETLVNAANRRAANRNGQLTSREQEILALVANGDTNKHIARRLSISENTVKFHLKRITLKVDAVGNGRASLAPAARRLPSPL